jgi:RHS repeat-associated protein
LKITSLSIISVRQKPFANYNRFGFNGKEFDWEAKGWMNQLDYGESIYNPRVGRFLSVDPLQKRFAFFSPYQFAGNQPIWAIDLDGLEPYYKSLVKHVPSIFDNEGIYVKIEDYEGFADARAIQYENRTYLIYETIHGNRQWYYEYDKEGFKGSPVEFEWYNHGKDKSFTNLMPGLVVGVPGVLIYGKAILIWLGKEILEEAAGVPVWDTPVDWLKQDLKREVSEEVTKEMAEKAAKKSTSPDYEGMEYLDDNKMNPLDRIPMVTQNAKDYAAHLKKSGGIPKHGYKGGREFLNDGREKSAILPKTDVNGNPITYKEYDIHPNVKGKNRGKERLVLRSDGSTYYSDDHYLNFVRIDQ